MKTAKHIIATLLLTITLAVIAIPFHAVAQGAKPDPTIETDKDTTTKKQIDEIFKIQKFTVDDGKGNKEEGNQALKHLSSQVSSKQEYSFADVFASIIKILTGVAVVMTFVGAIVAGVIYMFSEGEESKTTKAKTIMIYIIIGDLIIAASYAIVRGITLIKPLS